MSGPAGEEINWCQVGVGGGWKGRALGEGSLSAQILSWQPGWPWGPQAGKLKVAGRRDAGRGRELREAGSWKGQTFQKARLIRP